MRSDTHWDMLKTWSVRILPFASAAVAIFAPVVGIGVGALYILIQEHKKLMRAAAPATKPIETTTEFNIAGRVIPLEIIHLISTFSTPKDVLSLTSVNQHGFKNRFPDFAEFLDFAPLLHLFLKNTEKIQAFLAGYRCLKKADMSDRIICHSNNIKQLTLFLSNTFTEKDINDLVAALPNLTKLNIELDQTAKYAHLEALLVTVKKLPHLTQLHLSTPNLCLIGRLPSALWELTQLQTLELHHLYLLTALSPKIGQLTNLQTLILTDLYKFTALPSEIGQLTNLQTLTLEWLKNFTTLPPEIGQLTNLQTLYLGNLGLTALPDEIGQLTNLRQLSLIETRCSLPDQLQKQLSNCSIFINEPASTNCTIL